MPRRKSGAGRVTPSRRHKKDDDAPIHVSDREREVFQAEIGGRAERWAEEYADIVEQLPLELQRTFHLLRELDQRSETAKTDMDSVWKAYSCARAESSDEAQRYAHLMRLRDTSQQSISLAEEKLALALSAYDTVDRQIRRLDNDLLKNERSLYAGLRHELEGHDDTLQTPVPKETDRFSPAGQLLTFWSGLVSLDPLVCLAYLQEHMQKQAPEPSTPRRTLSCHSTRSRRIPVSHATVTATVFPTEIWWLAITTTAPASGSTLGASVWISRPKAPGTANSAHHPIGKAPANKFRPMLHIVRRARLNMLYTY